jgi:thiol-disulfide isomerase/thioredoxin
LTILFGAVIAASLSHWRTPLAVQHFAPAAQLLDALRVLQIMANGFQQGRVSTLPELSKSLRLGYDADFSLEDMQGKTHRLSDYRGKWVLVNYLAIWCPPCLNEIPELISLHNAHQDKDLSVIDVAMESGSSGKVADFAQAHGISYPVVMGNLKITAQIGAVEVLPVSYLYNPPRASR